MKILSSIPVVLTALMIALRCSLSPLAGNSSETQNGIMAFSDGKTVRGQAPAGSKLNIFNAEYVPGIDSTRGTVDSTVTGPDGSFLFSTLPGFYRILCVNDSSGLAVLTQYLVVQPGHADTIRDTLRGRGSIQGIGGKVKSGGINEYFVYLEASPFFARVDSLGDFHITGVPAGTHVLKIRGRGTEIVYSPESTPRSLFFAVQVCADSITTVEGWEKVP